MSEVRAGRIGPKPAPETRPGIRNLMSNVDSVCLLCIAVWRLVVVQKGQAGLGPWSVYYADSRARARKSV